MDINHATAAEWKRLPGWGEVLSQRTVKFREALGGFVSIEQLKLVYGLDPDAVERNRIHLKVQEGRKLECAWTPCLFAHLWDIHFSMRIKPDGCSVPAVALCPAWMCFGSGFPPIRQNVRPGSLIWTHVMGSRGGV